MTQNNEKNGNNNVQNSINTKNSNVPANSPQEQQSYRGQQSYQQPGANGQSGTGGQPVAGGQPGVGGQPAQPMLSSKERKKMEKLARAKARTTEDWMKREKKIVTIFSIVCAVLLILAIIGFALAGSSGSTEYVSDDSSYSESSDTEEKEYTAVTADELLDELSDNAAAAKDEYIDEDLAITGKIVTIDNNTDYIAIGPVNDDFALDSILCYTTTDDQRDQVKQLKNGQTVTVYGTVEDVGEVLGFSVYMDGMETD